MYKNAAAKVPSWMPLWWIKHDEVPFRVPFQWANVIKVPSPHPTGALFTIFTLENPKHPECANVHKQGWGEVQHFVKHMTVQTGPETLYKPAVSKDSSFAIDCNQFTLKFYTV